MKEIIPADVLTGGGHRRPGETAWSIDRSRAPRLLNRHTGTFKYCKTNRSIIQHFSDGASNPISTVAVRPRLKDETRF